MTFDNLAYVFYNNYVKKGGYNMGKKKILLLLFCLLGVVSIFFSNSLSASAEERHERSSVEDDSISDSGEVINGETKIIDKVVIHTNGTPKIGDPVNKLELYTDDNSGYRIQPYSTWIYINDEGTSDGMGNNYNYTDIDPETKIRDGFIYEYSTSLVCSNDDYAFSDDLIIEVDDPNANVRYDKINSYCYNLYIAYPYGCKTVNDVTINVEGLAVGNTLDDLSISYPENEGYALDFSSSIENSIVEYDPNTSSSNEFNGTFKEGYCYLIEFLLLPRERFIFADDMTINANIHSYQTTEFFNHIYSGEASLTLVIGPLCDHNTGNTYQKDANKHWQQCSKCDQIITEKEKHIYDDYRDENCNICNYKRTITFPNVNAYYRTHVQTYGWEGSSTDINTWKKNGTMSGTSGQAKRLEGINIQLTGNDNLGIQYTTHCQSYGWLPWSANGDMNGTEGEAKRLEAIKIQLTGRDSDMYDVYYRVHAQSYGWLNWAKNGAPAGTAGLAKRLEGIQVVVVKKGESFDKNIGGIKSANDKAYVAQPGTSPVLGHPATNAENPQIPGENISNVTYRTHVQSYGWQGWKFNGDMSGTSGQAKRLEGIEIKLTNQQYAGDIVYTTHVQSYGWQGKLDDMSSWASDGKMSGTSGQAKRLEAICINLTGDMAKKYDVYYRVHAQSYGWLGWAKNGAPAGTAGYAKRLEGIQVILVEKGSTPPETYGGITSNSNEAYISK